MGVAYHDAFGYPKRVAVNSVVAPGGLGRSSQRTLNAARAALEGRRRGLLAVLPFFGPAFIASVAYMDPGNFATNIGAGSLFGYRLLWVVVFANLTAMLFQALSAKLGIATGKSLPEVCREHLPRSLTVPMWVVSEVGAMATDVAEFLGATLALNLLFGLPLIAGAVVTGVATLAILTLQGRGFRPIEAFIAALVGVIAICYLLEVVFSHPSLGLIVRGSVTPWLGGSSSVLLAVGLIGATVMPHVVYLHSSLTQDRVPARDAQERRRLLRISNIEVPVALGLAGLINIAMMAMAAATFHNGHAGVADISSAYRTLTPLLGPAAAGVFLISLLASGISASSVGTMAGQVIMQGFVGFSIPLWLRRVLTMAPTLVVILIGVNVTQALILSQVVLSLVLPVPVIALVAFTRRRSLMGDLVNRRLTSVVAGAGAALIVVLNVVLLAQTFGLQLPL
jgi:manganese transport protein